MDPGAEVIEEIPERFGNTSTVSRRADVRIVGTSGGTVEPA
jgi:hypothetical protein